MKIKVSGVRRLWVRRAIIVTSLPFVLAATVLLAIPEIVKAWGSSLRTAHEQWSAGPGESDEQ
jgi:hypothetical protein